ncbi:hypothetical protein DPMN_048949 [Dreissena polymorpha]|uniref:Uncharacterized protein n=1 Tax=Dreissena polymorpha TaxID=45954 RepID=A0A9D4DCG3_DREPO|nr:hypothetical protein DPMN_048949 [Dreissena polymorpha]
MGLIAYEASAAPLTSLRNRALWSGATLSSIKDSESHKQTGKLKTRLSRCSGHIYQSQFFYLPKVSGGHISFTILIEVAEDSIAPDQSARFRGLVWSCTGLIWDKTHFRMITII